ncbi:hypothetical protein Dimus_023299 [Dionaea muscipula]
MRKAEWQQVGEGSAAATTASRSKAITSASGAGWRWDSPTPYLYGGIGLFMLIIAIALVILACSNRKPSSRSSSNHQVPTACHAHGVQPSIVVIMAGDHQPTYLATPT